LDCGGYIAFDLTADPANNRLFAIGPLEDSYAFLLIDPLSFSCKPILLGVLENKVFFYYYFFGFLKYFFEI
jgi:hypothetical protein